jgi:hypothetical protein
MPNYRSLTGGFYSKTPLDHDSAPTSIRSNNPGAVNGATWERKFPGYVTEVETTPGNRTTIFETPEQGIAAWWQLLKNYRAAGAVTVEQIITRYGGGQDYSNYLAFVIAQTHLPAAFEIKLDDDAGLLKLAKAMFKYEAGRQIPWPDKQIMYGIRLGRTYASGYKPPKTPAPAPTPNPPAKSRTIIGGIIGWFAGATGWLTALSAIDNIWAFAAFILFAIVGTFALWMIVSGRLRVGTLATELQSKVAELEGDKP